MSLRNTKEYYGSITKLFHWIIALAVILMLAAGFSFDFIHNNAFRHDLVGIHKATGLTILLFSCLRLLWWLVNIMPPLPASMPTWQRLAAHCTHLFLYLLTIIMPISGWIMTSAAGHTTNIFGLLKVTAPGITKGDHIGHTMHEWHHFCAWLLLSMVVLHTAASLKHHFIDKNNILKRII